MRVARASLFVLTTFACLHLTNGLSSASADETAAARPIAGAPSIAPPEEVQGAWIADDQPAAQPAPRAAVPMPMGAVPMAQPYAPPMYDEYAERAAYMYGGYPEEYAGIDLSGDPYAGYGGAPCADGSCGGQSCAECGHGRHCGHCGCCGGGPCGYLWDEVHSHRRYYGRAEYLYWQGKGNPLPALVTTAPNGTPQDVAGVLGEPETTVLYGQSRATDDWRSGGRITAGMWLVDGEFLGIEGHYFGLEDDSDRFFAEGEFSQGGTGPILARPFTEVEEVAPGNVTYTPASSLLAFDDYDDNGNIVDLDGQIVVASKVSTQSAGLLLRKLLWIDFTNNWRVDALGGYRFFRVNDGVRIHDFWTEVGGQLGDASFTSYDYFQARNEFHGGELGLAGSIFFGRFSLEAIGKLAMGNVHQTMKIDGTSFVSVAGSPYVETGNYRLLTQPTNDGRYKRDVFAVIPETNLNLRFDLTRNLRLIAGYNFIYMSQAQRSGKAIDLNVNSSQIGGALVGPAQPSFKFSNDNGYWLHGINVGVEARW